MPTLEPTALPEAAYKITMVPPEGWYLNRAVMELTITDLNGTGLGKRENHPEQPDAD